MTGNAFVSHRRRSDATGTRVAAAGTVAVHVLVGIALLTGPGGSRPPAPPVYAVHLVAAPRPEPDRRRAPEAVQRPAEAPKPTPRRTQRHTVADEPPPPVPEEQVDREPAPRSTPDVELAPETAPSTGADPETIDVPGIDFPFPAYLRNVVAQVYRRWQRPRRNVALRAEVLFFIHRDGSISNFQFVKRSGNLAFDLKAQGAVEAAGNARAFGPLPEGYPDDVLPVSFFFDPTTLKTS